MRPIEAGDRLLVRLEVGERLPDCLVELARLKGWGSGSLSGLGGVKDVTLAYYDLAKRQYLSIPVAGIVELVSLVGNLAWVNGEPLWHLHAAVAGPDGCVKGGHLLSMEVAITVECWIQGSTVRVNRRRDDFCGLNLLDI